MVARIGAVVDIGSATVHLLVARVQGGALAGLDEASDRLLLGERTAATGRVSPDAEAAVLATLQTYRRLAARLGAECFLVVATQALRASANGADVAARLGAAIGTPVALLTPGQETRLALRGAFGDDLPSSAVFADSGGASTQLAWVENGALVWQRSLPIGASNLTASVFTGDPAAPGDLAAADVRLDAAFTGLPMPPPGAATITGGSARTLAASAVGGCASDLLTGDCLDRAAEWLRGRTSAAVARQLGLPGERARILLAGCLIVRRVVRWSGISPWRVSAAGLREGILRAWAADPGGWLTASGGA